MKRLLLVGLVFLSGCATKVDQMKVAEFGNEVTRNQSTIKEGRLNVAQVKHVLRVSNDELGEDRLYKSISKNYKGE